MTDIFYRSIPHGIMLLFLEMFSFFKVTFIFCVTFFSTLQQFSSQVNVKWCYNWKCANWKASKFPIKYCSHLKLKIWRFHCLEDCDSSSGVKWNVFFSYVNPVVWQSTVFSINVSLLLLRNISNYFSKVPAEMTKMFKWRVDKIGLIFKTKSNILDTFTQLMDCYQYQGTTKYKYVVVFATQFMPFYAIPLEVRTMKQVYIFLRH